MRKRLKNHHEVCHYWANKVQSEGKCGNIFFEGPTIYSYGYHFPMATFAGKTTDDGREIVLMTTRRYSVTTSAHMSMVRHSLPPSARILHVPYLDEYEKNLASYQERVDNLIEELRRCRSCVAYRRLSIGELMNDARIYQQAFMGGDGVSSPCTLPPDYQSILDAAAAREHRHNEQARARDAARRAAAAEERRRLNALDLDEKIAAWREGKNPFLPWSLPVMLRMKDKNTVETSKGARVPLTDAEKAYRFAQRYVGMSYQSAESFAVGVYRLNRIDADGTVHIGCHTISPEEINRFAKERGWSE